MHGRKRTEYKHRFEDPQVAAGLAQKAQQWNALSAKALQLRGASLHRVDGAADGDATPESCDKHLQLLDKMLRVNPDPLHLWNHRRALLLQGEATTAATASGSDDWWPTELALTQAGLERNPKAYGAWFHRKWVLQQATSAPPSDDTDASHTMTATTTTTTLLSNELGLTEQFLQRDERNFHCWNYRRFVVGLELDTTTGSGRRDGLWAASQLLLESNSDTAVVIGPQLLAKQSTSNNYNSNDNHRQQNHATRIKTILQREWDFTKTKIVENFSNFSAFHYRSKLLLLVSENNNNDNQSCWCWSPIIVADDTASSTTVQNIAQTESSLMENIMFTEPDDQTIWWYHRFVLDWVQTHMTNATNDDEITDGWYSEWLQQQAETLQVLVEDTNEESGGCKWALLGYHLVLSRLVSLETPPKEASWESQLESILDQLMQIDPDRTQRYETMRRQP